MTIEKLKEELIKRLFGTKIKIKEVKRHCGRIKVEYSHKGKQSFVSIADCDLDKNDPVQCIANEIMLEEAV